MRKSYLILLLCLVNVGPLLTGTTTPHIRRSSGLEGKSLFDLISNLKVVKNRAILVLFLCLPTAPFLR
jgi:hypothetical protein